MIFEVNPAEFNKVCKDLIKNSKVMINFRVSDNQLYLQILEDYTICKTLPVKVIDNSGESEITVKIDKILLMLENKEFIVFNILGDILTITQGTFSTMVQREYEDARKYPIVDESTLLPMDVSGITSTATTMMCCLGMPKELSFSPPDVMLSNGRAYLDYQQAYVVKKVDMTQCCINANVFRSITPYIKSGTRYAYLKELTTLYIDTGMYEIYVPTIDYNLSLSNIKTVEEKLSGLTPVTDICFKDFVERVLILTSSFAKKPLTLTIGKNTFAIHAQSNNTYVSVGNAKDSDYILSIRITAAQCEAIMKLFKQTDKVTLSRGGNCICMSTATTSFLIAGIIF